MREVWLKIRQFNKELITTAIEKGINTFLVENENLKSEITKLAKVNIFTNNDIYEFVYENKKDEDKIVELSKENKLVLKTKSWEIIPWENLIAKKAEFSVYVKNLKELKTALGVLEKGVSGIILDVDNDEVLRELINELNKDKLEIKLEEAEIVNIEVLDSGERVCIDTCNLMSIGEGVLVGSSSNFLFLVHSESLENPYCAPRPFRVNAGAVYAYVKINNNKTKYLSELKAGDEILIVNADGYTRKGIVGRSKIETRPLILIEAKYSGDVFSVILQNAETINLVLSNGKPISVSKLKKGDKVLIHAESGGRHFGRKIEEKIIEK
jgi:3-dehydroquinate synthase II